MPIAPATLEAEARELVEPRATEWGVCVMCLGIGDCWSVFTVYSSGSKLVNYSSGMASTVNTVKIPLAQK